MALLSSFLDFLISNFRPEKNPKQVGLASLTLADT